MKIKLLFSAFFVCAFAFSQNYTFKKTAFSGQILKTKGTVKVTDTTITIKTKDYDSKFRVKQTLNSEICKQYKFLDAGEGYQMRFTLNIPKKPTKFNGISLLLETKDEFSGAISTLLYYLNEE